MGNRQATANRKSADATQDGGNREQQPEPEAGGKKRRRGRGRKVADVVPEAQHEAPLHPELITTATVDAEDPGAPSGTDNRKLLHLTIYRSYSPAVTDTSAASHGETIYMSKLTINMSSSHIFLNIQSLRTRPHNITLINKTKFLNDTDFIIRMLYKFSY